MTVSGQPGKVIRRGVCEGWQPCGHSIQREGEEEREEKEEMRG